MQFTFLSVESPNFTFKHQVIYQTCGLLSNQQRNTWLYMMCNTRKGKAVTEQGSGSHPQAADLERAAATEQRVVRPDERVLI